MLNIRNLVEAKKTARALEKALKAIGIELPHGQSLDTLARIHGFKDYNALTQSLSPESIDEMLGDFELSHIEGSADDRYGRECALVTHTGFELRYAANTEEDLDYVRVCDPLGREVAYWVSDEWRDDPQVVMGAILGALARGKPIDILDGKPVKAQQAKAAPAEMVARRVPRIQDLDFFKAHAVIFGGTCYNIAWREEGVLPFINQSHESQDFIDNEDATALTLTREEDGLVWEEQLSLGKLASLTWSPEKRCFVDPEGETYTFYFEVDTETYLAMQRQG